ncbi:MAG: ATP-binding cassette domain-containing protein [Muribaculaceae bacterium]|nr:ATP-binding cassette domain-containing protein [Muribaculaceae bacterium]
MDNILEIENLRKDFASTRALDGVSFNVRRGSICGLLGPNGAGKTTLLRIVNSILAADGGSVKINGAEVSLATTKFFGYMPEERGLYDKMRVEDQIMFFGRLKGGDPKRLRAVMDDYLALFNLSADKRRRIKELSKGNQQKVQIIATIVHEPELVILDEPFSGFDPINGAILQELISRLHAAGTTVMLSSHNMNAIEEICDDIALVNKGHLLVNDSISNIKDAHKDDSLILTTASPLTVEAFLGNGVVSEITPIAPHGRRKGYSYKIRRGEGKRNFDILDLASFQSEILHFEEALPSLTDIFIKYTLPQEGKTA